MWSKLGRDSVLFSGKPTVADIFRAQSDNFIDQHSLGIQQFKVIRAITRCRTAALGGHADVCPNGQEAPVISYNSCRNRHCNKCQSQARERWMDARGQELLQTRYFHVIFTLPHELHRGANGIDTRSSDGDDYRLLSIAKYASQYCSQLSKTMQSLRSNNMECLIMVLRSRLVARIGIPAVLALAPVAHSPGGQAQAIIDLTGYEEKNSPKSGGLKETSETIQIPNSRLIQATSHGPVTIPPPDPLLPLELHVKSATVSGMSKKQPVVTLEVRIHNISTEAYKLPVWIEAEKVPSLPIHKGRRSLLFRGKFIVSGTTRQLPFSAALSVGADTASGSLITMLPGDSVIVRLKTMALSDLWAWSTEGTTEVDVQASLQETRWADVDDPHNTTSILETSTQVLLSTNLLRMRLEP